MTDYRADYESRIKIATVSAENPQTVADSYIRYFGYKIVQDNNVSEAEALAWGTPGMKGMRQIIVAPESGTQVFMRIIENPDLPACEPLKTYGWTGIEITLQDADALNERLKNSPFKIIGEPALLDFSDRIYPMQAVGLAGEMFYLNEVRGDLPDYNLPLARSFVDHVFIMVLATPDMQQAINFYRDNFGWDQGNSYCVPYSVINNAFAMPEETEHELSMTCVGRDVNNEVDTYPDSTEVRNCNDGMLPPGIAMTSYMVADLDAIKADLIAPPVRLEGMGYGGKRVACCTGWAGELIELIEIG